MFYLHIIHYIGFIVAQILNTFLVFLILTKAQNLFQSYRHVMLIFALCSMLLSWVEILTQPVLYMKGPMFLFFVGHSYLPKMLRDKLPAIHCGTFGFLIAVLAAQFFHRYLTLCKTHLLKYFEQARLATIFIPSLIVFIAYFELVEWGMHATLEKRENLRDDLARLYNTDSMSVSSIASLYWNIGANGEKVWQFKDIVAALVECLIIITFSSLIVFFALKIYFYMNTACANMSAKTLELNRQLFRMLIVQTIVPFIFMYIPVILFITLPFFELSMGKFVNWPSISVTLYPIVEPLITMYFIADFRKTIKKFFFQMFASFGASNVTSVSNNATQP